MDRKKAEVRARLEAQSASKKKKGFMTPERKKKLRVLMDFSLIRTSQNYKFHNKHSENYILSTLFHYLLFTDLHHS